MTTPRRGPTVLIVDPELGFLFWLGEVFNDADCLAIPATNCAEAVSLTRSLGIQLDVVVVDPQLNGVEWMIQTLRQSHRWFKVVSIIDNEAHLGDTIQPKAMLRRPRHGEAAAREDYLDRVTAILRHIRKLDTGTHN